MKPSDVRKSLNLDPRPQSRAEARRLRILGRVETYLRKNGLKDTPDTRARTLDLLEARDREMLAGNTPIFDWEDEE